MSAVRAILSLPSLLCTPSLSTIFTGKEWKERTEWKERMEGEELSRRVVRGDGGGHPPASRAKGTR